MMVIPGFEVELATVRCLPSGREARVMVDTTVLDAVKQLHLPLGQSCDGVGLCGFCRVLVVEGLENLSAAADAERELLSSLRAERNERLACLARVRGPVTVTTSYWG